MYTVNIWPVIVAAIVSFGIGALWYSPVLFGKEYLTLTKVTEADIAAAKAKGMWKSYLIQFIASVVTFAVIAFIVSISSIMSGSDGAFLGFVVWLGFTVPMNVSELLWKKAPMKLVVIESVQMLISFLIGGSIVGAWR